MNTPWMTTAEAAEYARVSEETVLRWIREGRVNPVVSRRKKILKSRGSAGYIIEQADLDEAMRAMKRNVAGENAGAGPPSPGKRTATPAPSSGIAAFKRGIRGLPTE